MLTRRTVLTAAGAGLGTLAAPAILRAQAPRVVKMGSLRLIHSMTPHFYERFAPPAASASPRPRWARRRASRSSSSGRSATAGWA